MPDLLGSGCTSRLGRASLAVGVLALIGGTPAGGLAQKPDSGRAARHRLSVADLPEIKVFEEVAVSNDGRWAAYTMSRPFPGGHRSERGEVTVLDLQRKTKHVVELEGEARGLTWSPVGTTLAFMAPSKGHPRIWLYSPSDRSAGARILNGNDTLSQGVQAIGWSPNGSEIGFLAKGPAAPGGDSARVSPRVVVFRDEPGVVTETTSDYRPDSVGLYLAITSIERGSGRLVARGLVTTQGWLPTVRWVRTGLVVEGAPLGQSSPRLLVERRISLVDPRTGRARHIGPDYPGRFRVSLSPSGRAMAYLDYEHLPDRPRVPGVFSLRLSEVAHPESTSAASPTEIDGLISDRPPVWADERTVYIGRHVNATPRLYAVDVSRRTWRQLTPDTLSVSAYATGSNGQVLLAVLENANQQQELYRVEPRTGALTRLTHEGDSQPDLHLGRVEEVNWLSADSRFTVHGFLVKPPDYDPGRRYPLVVIIHGGPGGTYPNAYQDIALGMGSVPPQMLAAHGYLVLLPNPRGDFSYGFPFRDATYGDYGPGPYADVIGGVSALIHRGLADSTAVGIYGGSYGAYLTAYAITQTRRFAAAVMDDGMVNLTSFYGQTYATSAPGLKHYFGGTPWIQEERYRSQSPITYVERVRTPVWMRYGGRSLTYDDVRPSFMLAQGLEFYAALRDNDVPVEFIIHPDQGHGVDDWVLFQDYCQRILTWFEKWFPHETGMQPARECSHPHAGC